MTADEDVIAQTRDPEGRDVVLLRRIWDNKLATSRPELAGYQDEVLVTVTSPTIVRMILATSGSGTTGAMSALRDGSWWS